MKGHIIDANLIKTRCGWSSGILLLHKKEIDRPIQVIADPNADIRKITKYEGDLNSNCRIWIGDYLQYNPNDKLTLLDGKTKVETSPKKMLIR